jgi:3-isopropylmalate dehydrogenase
MSDAKKILMLAGDGVGPEVCKEATKIINAVTECYKFPINIEEELIGGASIDVNGVPLSDEVVDKAKHSDAIVLGAVGGPKWDHLSPKDGPEKGLLRIRSDLNLFANLRPCIAFSETANASSLKADVIKNLDLLIVRELTGGIYFGQPRNKSDEEAFNTMIYSRKEIVRIAEVAFEGAMRRSKKLCSVDKANVLEVSELWREVVEDVSKNYPEVELSHMLVDNAAMQLVKNPKQFDVIVSSNLFGDILSDIGSMLTGSIGMLPSASLDTKSKGLYEPVHGTAPDIAGKGIVNPIATILSVAMMYKYTFHRSDIYLEIENAVKQVLANGYATPDIANEDSKILTTEEMGSLISDYV